MSQTNILNICNLYELANFLNYFRIYSIPAQHKLLIDGIIQSLNQDILRLFVVHKLYIFSVELYTVGEVFDAEDSDEVQFGCSRNVHGLYNSGGELSNSVLRATVVEDICEVTANIDA
jgi:hypothetical protein